MPSQKNINLLARLEAQRTLSAAPGFHQLDRSAQLSVYRTLVDKNVRRLSEGFGNGGGLSSALAEQQKKEAAAPKRASDLIDDARHENRRIDQAGQLAGEFIQEVNFPQFVKDLLKGVFDANLNVTLEQMKAYQELLKTATASVAKFVNAIDDTAAFGYLAENNSDEFSIDFDDEKNDGEGNPAVVLTDAQGNRLDIGDNEVKAKIMDAKIAMAKEQRALLRESILMGITRLVVERGTVKASVLFDVKASERIEKQDKAAMKEAHAHAVNTQAGTGLIGKIFGGGGVGTSHSYRKTQISVSSAKSQAATDLAAQLAGSVEIVFKSDYFKLDNFATMYSGVTEADRQQVTAGRAAPARG